MDNLWAPWRLAYVAKAKPASTTIECFICRGLSETDDKQNLIVSRGQSSVVMLNRYPYNNGHLLVAPKVHKGTLSELTNEEVLESIDAVRRMIALLTELMRPDGYNVGLNLGQAAGAGLPGHLHWHLVPRWNGDTNFMPVCADVKVIAQSLDALFNLLVNRCAT